MNAALRVVRGACPHDCPDTCALLVEVDAAGRATSIKGDADHPITAGFLCGKVSNYLERVYSDERLLRPLVRTGAKGEGRFREVSWDEALDVAARGLQDAIDRHGGASVVPYSYLGTQGLVQGDVMGNRLFDAIGGSTLVRTICASAGVAGTMATNGASPEVDPEEWVHARTIVVWGWNPLSTAPHLWRLILEARRRGARLIAVDPFRSRTARVADVHLRPLPGTDARARARRHARAARRRPRRRGVVPRARARLRRAGRAPRGRDRRASTPRSAACRPPTCASSRGRSRRISRR